MTNPRVAAARTVMAMGFALACLPKLPEPDPDATVACGVKGQPCCGDGSAACGAALRCDAADGVCVDEERRYCTGDDQCRAGQTCCISGVIGSCASLEPGSGCPQADLVVELSRESLALAYEIRGFDPVLSVEDACAIEKGCLGAAGQRALLHFSGVIRNVGQADLLFGASSESPFVVAACDGQPYLPGYLDYRLVDAQGGTVARGAMEAACRPAPEPYASELDCNFGGLPAGWSQFYTARPNDPEQCQWIDVTGVAPGDYVLRVQVNQQALLTEARLDNNRADIPVRLPAFDDPAQPCPPPAEAALLGSANFRECGWSPAAGPTPCTPGETIELNCSIDCRVTPLLRVCEGTQVCLADNAVSQNTLFDVGQCNSVTFTCPVSGTYGVYWAPLEASTVGAGCRLQRLDSPLEAGL